MWTAGDYTLTMLIDVGINVLLRGIARGMRYILKVNKLTIVIEVGV